MAYTLGVTLTPDTLSYLRTVSEASVSQAVRLAVAAWGMDTTRLLIGHNTLNTTCTLDEVTIDKIRLVAAELGIKSEGRALRLILEDCERRTPRIGNIERRVGERRS